MLKTKRILLTLALVIMTQTAMPVYAASESPGLLPPLPQWPIIGPILQWIGIVPEAETPEAEVLDPTLPEFRVTSWEDLKALETDLPRGERVRIIATDKDLNAVFNDLVDGKDAVQSGSIDFDTNSVSGEIALKRELLEDYDVEIPDFISGDSLKASGTAEFSVESCRPVINIKKLRLNGRNMGLGKIAQGAINKILEENWISDVCLERVILTDGEIAVEGIWY
ncbi:MAG: hypothetical protein JW981_10385 [Anaerolineae bacterium]|nr:hypothetical protein [Anaerolineae bacterium]